MKTFIADIKEESKRMAIIPKTYRKCKACGKKLALDMENYKVRDEREKELYQKIKESQNEMVELTDKFKAEDHKYHKAIRNCNKNKDKKSEQKT